MFNFNLETFGVITICILSKKRGRKKVIFLKNKTTKTERRAVDAFFVILLENKIIHDFSFYVVITRTKRVEHELQNSRELAHPLRVVINKVDRYETRVDEIHEINRGR